MNNYSPRTQHSVCESYLVIVMANIDSVCAHQVCRSLGCGGLLLVFFRGFQMFPLCSTIWILIEFFFMFGCARFTVLCCSCVTFTL